jgi:hypothetical protein
MKHYRNKVTGAVIDVPCALGGSDWEEVTEAKEEPKAEEKAPEKAAPKKRTAKKG